MKIIFNVSAWLVVFATVAMAQEVVQLQTSTGMDSGRFEIIQKPADRSTSFRLDKFTGRIDRLTTCNPDGTVRSHLCWKEMDVLELPETKILTRPIYQIVINVPRNDIFLLNIETGQTWQYGIEPKDRWYPFKDCSDRSTSFCLWKP